MKKKWINKARTRVREDCEQAMGAMILQRAIISHRQRVRYNLSRSMTKQLARGNSEWLQAKLSKLAILEVVLERRRMIGRWVWRLYRQMVKAMEKQKEEKSGVATSKTVPQNQPAQEAPGRGPSGEAGAAAG